MSTTPTANITSKSPTPSPNFQTPSRRIEHDSQLQLSQSTTSSNLPTTEHSPSDTTVDLPSSHITARASSHHSHPEEDVSTRRPTKRKRRNQAASMSAEGASSMSDSSSQSGMADNETEAERSQQSERSVPPVAPPPKKKRTRTLTTPHQSAVLHALLAKSRFPTTAMREEVGRQIGLSARKVQIWFQNQRQKARRPQGESAPLTRPPQFGPFPSMGSAGPSTSTSTSTSTSSYLSSGGGGSASETPQPGPSSSCYTVPESRRSLDSNSGLSGPGIPGPPSSYQRRPASAGVWEPSRQAPASPESALAGSQQPRVSRTSEAIPSRDSRDSMRTLVLQPSPAPQADMSPQLSRVLPPISPSALELRSSIGVSAASSFSSQHRSRTPVNIVRRHDSTSHPTTEEGISPSLNIPPPFALQPQPQWDPQTFTPYTRPEFASWSNTPGSSLSARASFSAVGAHDRVTHNVSPNLSHSRYFYPSSGEHRRIASSRSHPFDPLHDIIPPSPGQRFSPASSRPSVSGESHARSDDEAGEH
ncbi:homeobox-domain-containing protein [Gyrodon lividus]|nr:homeobox-domain-containing protein [Gyrodon lividus]